MQPIVFPDTEAWAIRFLDVALKARPEPYASAVYIGNAVPSEPRSRMVIVRRDGGTRLDAVREQARLTLRVYGSTEKEAADLAALVRALLGASADGRPILAVRESIGPTRITDEAGKPAYRYLGVELTVRGTAL